jgi:Arc/MetJ-type ribon-helix-helix transcriptional regulator
MTINLTPEQEQRIQAVIRRGTYESVEEVVEAALTYVKQLTELWQFVKPPGVKSLHEID